MFAVYCSVHRSRVLMFPDNIESLVNSPTGVEIHWRCGCGQAGVEHLGRTEKIVGSAERAPLQLWGS